MARLCAELQRAGDEERRRLARLLHDSTAQTMAAVSMNLTLVERSATGLTAAARTALTKAQELAAASCREVGDLSHSLYPLGSGGNGLGSALGWLAAREGAIRLRVAVETTAPIDPEVQAVVFRLVQEALAGAFATEASVSVRVTSIAGAGVQVTLQGRMRRGAALDLATLGLRQRARAAGGNLRILRSPGGTSIEARFPGRP